MILPRIGMEKVDGSVVGLPATRRSFLLGGAAFVASAGIAAPLCGASRKASEPDFTAVLPDGTLQIVALTDRAFRVRFCGQRWPASSPVQ